VELELATYVNSGPPSEPHILYNGKVIDGANGKELHKFDPGACSFVSRDGKALVRMIK
jgi:hypothetical protein